MLIFTCWQRFSEIIAIKGKFCVDTDNKGIQINKEILEWDILEVT